MEKVSPLHPSLPDAAAAVARGNRVRPQAAVPAGPFPTFLTQGNWLILLAPRLLALRNGLRRRDRGGKVRALVLATLMALFWCGTFWFFHRVLHYFQTIPDFGPILTQKLLGMTFLTFLTVLLFSNVITGLSTFFRGIL